MCSTNDTAKFISRHANRGTHSSSRILIMQARKGTLPHINTATAIQTSVQCLIHDVETSMHCRHTPSQKCILTCPIQCVCCNSSNHAQLHAVPLSKVQITTATASLYLRLITYSHYFSSCIVHACRCRRQIRLHLLPVHTSPSIASH